MQRDGAADLHLDLFGRALADSEVVAALYVSNDRFVHRVAGHTDRLFDHDAVHRDHRRFRAPAADIDDHVAAGRANGDVGADGCREGFRDEVRRPAGASLLRRVTHGALLDAGDAGGMQIITSGRIRLKRPTTLPMKWRSIASVIR